MKTKTQQAEKIILEAAEASGITKEIADALDDGDAATISIFARNAFAFLRAGRFPLLKERLAQKKFHNTDIHRKEK